MASFQLTQPHGECEPTIVRYNVNKLGILHFFIEQGNPIIALLQFLYEQGNKQV